MEKAGTIETIESNWVSGVSRSVTSTEYTAPAFRHKIQITDKRVSVTTVEQHKDRAEREYEHMNRGETETAGRKILPGSAVNAKNCGVYGDVNDCRPCEDGTVISGPGPAWAMHSCATCAPTQGLNTTILRSTNPPV